MDSTSSIPGRGGASLLSLSSTSDTHTLLLVFGASREEQFDDIWQITVDRTNYCVTDAKQITVKENDGIGKRNSMGAAVWTGKAVFFGGQDSE